MSAEATGSITGVCLALLTACAATLPEQAAAEELPDMALLEYLGSWEDTDEDWVLFEKDEHPDSEDREVDSDAQSDESQESEDER